MIMDLLSVVVSLIISSILTFPGSSGVKNLKFPTGFKFGVASAAYQVEGGWNVSDKGESVWDRFTHNHPEKISDGSSGDVACDSYHLWRRDVEMLQELGVQHYRFSISWPRLLPTGLPDKISSDGKKYYNELIDGLLEKGIEPVVTLYHWDLPQRLQDYGGWLNPFISDWFGDYAREVYTLFGDRVKIWLTINEPLIMCDFYFNTGSVIPALLDSETAPYLCNKHVLIAHAKAWRIYNDEFKHKFHGKVAINNQLFWFEPLKPAYQNLADLVMENCDGRYSHPIYSKEGGWPPEIEKALAEVSKRDGHEKSKLPAFTKEEIDFIKGTYDFYSMNHYASHAVRPALPGELLKPWPLYDCPDLHAKIEKPPSWIQSDEVDWFWNYPEGLRKLLNWLKNNYGDMEIMIMESGYPTKVGLRDADRVMYFNNYLKQVLLSIHEDKVNVTRYTIWTLMDNYEWISGYRTKFGLYQVDFKSPQRTRTQRSSAKYYTEIIRTHSLPEPVRNLI